MFSARPMATKTPGRENAIYRGPMTVHGKGKQNLLAPVQPHSVQPQRTKDALSKNPTRLVIARPLGDKTPFPNRDAAASKFATPLPGAQKIAKLVLLDANRPSELKLLHPGATPDSVARPSSTRKHVRAPRSASKQFETPVTTGNHWDVSELDLVVPPAAEPQAPAPPTDDYDEIEYMPPNTLDTQYTPPFEFSLPNYAAVGASLLHLAHSYPHDDTPPPEFDSLPAFDVDAYTCAMPAFARPELQSDDPFLEAPPPKSRPATAASARLTAVTATAARKPLVSAMSRKPLVSAAARKPLASTANKPPISAASASWQPLAPASNKPAASAASNKPQRAASKRAAPNKPLPAASNRPLPIASKTPVVRPVSNKPAPASVPVSRWPVLRRPLSKGAAIVSLVGLEVGAAPEGEEFLFDV
ncbi:hypothetical protein B0H17DRAFT_1335482 [Mycena rosella]|uniref:Uncharacterized protein n=1 Tax=Mycena rosella TaxID=1033263 RepID=A0AAD7CZI6_MYCRO|nr:hypothetical protein B0H17DRAFT_1335482 [Mycena rosella]